MYYQDLRRNALGYLDSVLRGESPSDDVMVAAAQQVLDCVGPVSDEERKLDRDRATIAGMMASIPRDPDPVDAVAKEPQYYPDGCPVESDSPYRDTVTQSVDDVTIPWVTVTVEPTSAPDVWLYLIKLDGQTQAAFSAPISTIRTLPIQRAIEDVVRAVLNR